MPNWLFELSLVMRPGRFFLDTAFLLVSRSIGMPRRGLAFTPFLLWKKLFISRALLLPKELGVFGKLWSLGFCGQALTLEIGYISTSITSSNLLSFKFKVFSWLVYLGFVPCNFIKRAFACPVICSPKLLWIFTLVNIWVCYYLLRLGR